MERMLLLATDETFAAHDPGPGHPERIARLGAVAEGVAAAGVDDALGRARAPRRDDRRARPRARSRAARAARAALGARWRPDRPRHRGLRRIVGGGAPRRRRGPVGDRRDRARRGVGGVPRCPAPGPPRDRPRPHGLLPAQQRRGRGGRARRQGRARHGPRLRRAPRQRHPGDLLERPARPLRVDARVAALPGDRPPRRHRWRARRGDDVQPAAPCGDDR